MSRSFTSFRPSKELQALFRTHIEMLAEQTDLLSSLQDRAIEILMKPASAALDTTKFAATVVSKFEWLKSEYVQVKELVAKCKESGEDCKQALEFQKHMEDAHIAYSYMKAAQQHGLKVDGVDSFSKFFDAYVDMMKALHACSAVAAKRW